jgi:G3E family GTPase
MKRTRLILVGGFLGTGKTTLLRQAAQEQQARGERIALITNDQAPGLVDTGLFQQAGWDVGEIAGGCFCCKFDDLIGAANRLVKQSNPDVIMGEPVGSCTDLSATVLQPIKDTLAGQFDLAPFTVLIDPLRLRDVLGRAPLGTLHPSARYILRKQLEEADLIVLNKADQIPATELDTLAQELRNQFPGTPQLRMSALRGEGIPEWLDLMEQRAPVGQKIADVDYDTYAEGEAVLGWLNATATLSSKEAVDWGAWSADFLDALQQSLAGKSAEIAHVKLLMVSATGQSLIANLAGSREEAIVQGQINGDSPIELVLNARVQIGPEELLSMVEERLRAACGDAIKLHVTAIQSLSPGRPQPLHRYATAVG